MCRVIVITSGKGGVGKTTAVACLGAALAQMDKRVAMIDTDIGLRNLDVILGLEDRITFDLVDVAAGLCELNQALVKHPQMQNLTLLPAAQTRDKSAVSPAQMRVIIAAMRPSFDYILVDCPAGIEQGFKNAVAGADSAIVVTNPEVSAVRDADRVIGLLGAYDLPGVQLIINKIRPKMVRRGDMMTVQDILDVLDGTLLGVVPDDETIIKAGNLGRSILSFDCAGALAYRKIARALEGEAPVREDRRKRRLLGRLFDGFKGGMQA
jgi:septum site-determining protein MinD